jgi:rhamnosyltransferase
MIATLPETNLVTVVIPTCNAGQGFADLLDSLQTQTLKPTEIIIIDSESTDKTLEIAKKRNCKVITIDRADFDHGTARNLAMAEVSSEFAILLTQDATPVGNCMIAELIKPMQANMNIAICYGCQLPRPDAWVLERFARGFNYPANSILKTKNDIETLGLKTFFCSNSCSAIRRSIFEKLGGFKDNVIVNEDMHFAAKAILRNHSVYYSATAGVYHSHRYNFAQKFKRYFNIGRFFADNRWLLKQAGLKRYGGGMLKAGIKTFWQKKWFAYIGHLFAEFIVKAMACKLGWYYQLLFYKKQNKLALKYRPHRLAGSHIYYSSSQ